MTHQIRIAGTDVQFPCTDGQTLLDAGFTEAAVVWRAGPAAMVAAVR